MDNICNFCSKEFSNRINLLQHQKTVKSCLKLQGKQEDEANIECVNCKKLLAVRSYKQHKIKCDVIFQKSKQEQEEKNDIYDDLKNKYKILEKQNKKLNIDLSESKSINDKLKIDLSESKSVNDKLKLELAEIKGCFSLLREQNERLHSSSASVTMKLAEKVGTVYE